MVRRILVMTCFAGHYWYLFHSIVVEGSSHWAIALQFKGSHGKPGHSWNVVSSGWISTDCYGKADSSNDVWVDYY